MFLYIWSWGCRRLSIDTGTTPDVLRVVQNRSVWSQGAFANSEQQDAHEAFCRLVDACEAVDWNTLLALSLPAGIHCKLMANGGTNADRYSTPFWRAIGGVQKSIITCKACQSTSSTFEAWHHLSLALPESRSTLEQLFSNHFKTAPLSDPADKCEHARCRTFNRREKADHLVRWPAILVVHLKRWEVVSTIPLRLRKVDTEVQYETVFLPEHLETAYHLRGVVEHHGNAGGGHYTSMVRAPDNYWYRCDDEESPARVSTGTALKAQAMILVYERS